MFELIKAGRRGVKRFTRERSDWQQKKKRKGLVSTVELSKYNK